MEGETALLIIDTQLGMFQTPGLPPVLEGERLLGNIEGLIQSARDAGVTVIHVRHAGGPGHPLEKGTEGWGIHPRVAPVGDELVVDKETPDSFLGTALEDELETRGIGRLVLAGMQTQYCVDTTCRRAFSLGYDVTLVKDGHGTWDNDDLSAAQIVAHHNGVLGSWCATAVNADEVRFGEPATR